ncbi:MAG TPA: SDR family oxidoreductase [Clostridia bacterium]|jgi:NAD(P)-dependent dehydrogenase (short-subunit alcohol dehydrogenase family)|nr:SDR family oxidoreductase [Clostridia bacterium]
MGKTMMVTGATRNTGYAVAKRFLKEGYDVCITSRSQESADEAAKKLMEMCPGRRVLSVSMDPGKIEDIRSAFKIIAKKFGHLNVFVPNAVDMGNLRNTMNVTPDYWDAVMNVNVRGYFFTCQEAIKLMKNGGSIVMIGSVHAHGGIPNKICYSTSKAAVLGMMHCMAVEMSYLGIRVNAITAGAIRTERWEEQDDTTTQKRRDQYPAGRESFPDEIAGGVYYLCSDEASTIVGAELTIDSGISVCLLPYNKHWNA